MTLHDLTIIGLLVLLVAHQVFIAWALDRLAEARRRSGRWQDECRHVTMKYGRMRWGDDDDAA